MKSGCHGGSPGDGGAFFLARTVGFPRALELMLRGRILSAEEALQIGLVHEVVDDDQLMTSACELAVELATGPQVAMRLLKRSIHQAASLTWEQSLDEIAAKTAISDHLPDAKEGGDSFREKRDPKFNAWLD